MSAVKEQTKEDRLADGSRRQGAGGWLETALRRFRNLSFIVLIFPVAFICCAAVGLALTPAIFFIQYVETYSSTWPALAHVFALGTSLAIGFVIYGHALILVVPAVNFLMPFRVKPFRGIWYSLPTIPWYIHNALTYIVRYTFLEFATPSPANILFYRLMGMKIGKGVVINTTNISDASMIELGDHVTIGGSAHIMAHYGQRGYLVISPVKIESGATIGLKATVMGGVTVGKDCVIKPHTVLLPKSIVPDGETV